MGAVIIVINVCLCSLLHCIVSFAENVNDTVVIEASDDQLYKRDAKQVLLQPAYTHPFVGLVPQVAQSHVNPSLIATTGSCYNSKGELGKCIGFRQCYPYFKLPEVGNVDAWLLGMYDTCSYYTSQGHQIFGVCCSNPPKPVDSLLTTSTELTIEKDDNPEEANSTSINNLAEGAKIPNWPPPIPTHPPDHTIPPLPTHPPSPGYPGLVTPTQPEELITMKQTNKPAYKPTITVRPINKPTTTKPVNEIGTAACGSKNGFQDQGKIVGGHSADVNEWPWIAALFNSGRQFCGGSLIDSTHILSAAHCVAHMSSWDVARLTVRLGDHNIKTNSEVRHIEKRVKRVVRHRGFDSRTLYNDIAILTLDSPVNFNSVIRPVCLPSSGSRDWAGSTATVIGWGSIRESGPQPAVLQEVNIPIWSNRDCKLKYGHAAPGGIVEHMLCAGQANRDSCSGDSGGPLMVNNGKWTQVGIVSWGIGCGKGQYPGVYTRVEKFLPWIYKNLK